MPYLVLVSVTLNEGYKQLLRYVISDSKIEFFFSDIFSEAFYEVLSNRRKSLYSTYKEYSIVKIKEKDILLKYYNMHNYIPNIT